MGHFRSHQTLVEFVTEIGSLNVIRKRTQNTLAEITSFRAFGTIVWDEHSRGEDSKLLTLDGVMNEASRGYLEKEAIGNFNKIQVKDQLPSDLACWNNMRTSDVKCFRIIAVRAWFTNNLLM